MSLVEQTVSVLREQIDGGRWLGNLPGEHALSAQLHVGRKTLRAALDQLEREGLVKCEHGLPRKIIRRRRKTVKREGRRVVLLMPGELQSLSPIVVFLIDKLREHLAAEGCQLETHPSRAVYRLRAPTSLDELSRSLHPAGWVLVHSTEPMQQWFAARQLPCVVVGSLYQGVKLSSVDMDYGAVCTHAVSQFVSRGHKRLALVNPRPAAAGDFHTVAGFLDAAARHQNEGITSEVIQHDGTVPGICKQVELLRARPEPPTALLVSRAHHFLTVMTFLIGAGAKIPKDVALISRESDPSLDSVVPQVTRYSQNPNAFAANASRMVMQMIRGSARREECKIMPNFIRGETIG
jgi:DNA-binding LacI/PurR family transcriptional regulator